MGTYNNPKPNDKFFYLTIVSIFTILVFLPDILTWLTLPQGMVFNGMFVNIDDGSVYLSAIRQGAQGAWLFTPQFTPENLPNQLAYFPYILTGKFQNLLGGSLILWLEVLKLVSLLLALSSLVLFLKIIYPDQIQLRKTTFIMLLYSGGFGWIAILITGQPSLLTPDLFVPEWNTITTAFSAPHFLLGIAFQACFFSAFIKLSKQFSLKNFAAVTLSGTALGLSYPFLIAVDGLVLTSYFIMRTIKLRTVPWKFLLLSGAASLPMISYLVYYGYYLPQDPIWQLSLIANNQIIPPPPLGVVVGLGLLFFLLIMAVKPFWEHTDLQIIILWFIANLIALYLPFSFSGRFLLGMFIPVAVMAAYGLEAILIPKVRTRTQTLRKLALWFTFPSTILFVLWAFLGANSTADYPYYYQQVEVEAAQWLAEHVTEDDVVLTAYPIGNLIPRYTKGRVFVGHLNLTINLEDKLAQVRTFYQPDTPQSWRDQFIRDWDITYIYQGRFENSLSTGLPLKFPYKIVYNSNHITIYQIMSSP